MVNPTGGPIRGSTFVVIGLIWFTLAVVAGASGLAALLHPPIPQLVLLALTALVLLAALIAPSFRAWVGALELRSLVALHLTRFVGGYFLVLHARGQLPQAFAVPGGWGDIATASLALGLLIFIPRLEKQPRLVLAWNIVGFADMVFAVITAGRLAMADPASMAPMLRLPLSLLPTFLVPLIIASHVLLFWRLRQLGAFGGRSS